MRPKLPSSLFVLGLGVRCPLFCLMRRPPCHILALFLACLPLLAVCATNESSRIELRCESQVVRIGPGLNEPEACGSYDVRIYDCINSNELIFADGLVLPRDGIVTRAWFADLNNDGQAEIAVWVASPGPEARGRLDMLVLENRMLQKVEMPELAKAWQRGYQGHDTFRVEKGVIYRAFPLYKGNDTEIPPTGERTFKLICESERWMWRLHAVK